MFVALREASRCRPEMARRLVGRGVAGVVGTRGKSRGWLRLVGQGHPRLKHLGRQAWTFLNELKMLVLNHSPVESIP
jgi:hypothetical protein